MLAGEIDSATAVLERYLETPSLQRAQQDNFNLWYVLILLGEAYEAAGRAEEAALAYSRLLDLWETPDDGLQRIVDDLTRRVARLTGETAGQ